MLRKHITSMLLIYLFSLVLLVCSHVGATDDDYIRCLYAHHLAEGYAWISLRQDTCNVILLAFTPLKSQPAGVQSLLVELERLSARQKSHNLRQ